MHVRSGAGGAGGADRGDRLARRDALSFGDEHALVVLEADEERFALRDGVDLSCE